MKTEKRMRLEMTSSEFNIFCEKQIKSSASSIQVCHVLTVIESFVTACVKNEDDKEDYEINKTQLKSLLESSREKMLEKNSRYLSVALKQCNASFLAMLHSSVERKVFYQLLQNVLPELNDDDIRLLMVWTANWVKEAEQLSQDNDEVVEADEYRVMMDLDRVLNSQS